MNEIIWDDSPVPSGDIIWDEPKKERSTLDSLKRAAGLTGRYAVEGLAAIPGIVVDPLYQAAGLTPWTQGLSNTLTKMGVPAPEGAGEKVSAAVSKGMMGGGAFAGASKVMPMLGPLMAQGFGPEIAAQGIGSGASEAVKESGGGFIPQVIAGAVAPMGAGAAYNVAKRGVNTVVAGKNALTTSGADQIAADVLGKVTADKAKAIDNLSRYNKLKADPALTVGVPGSAPYSAAIAGDYGIIGGHQLASMNPTMGPAFAKQSGIANEARVADLAKLKATDAQLAFYANKRDEATKAMRESAFAAAKGPVNVEPVLDEIFRTFRTHKGQGAAVEKALDYIYGRIEKAKATGALHPQDLYDGLYKDINDMVRKGIDTENGRIQLAAGVATGIKKTLAQAIEEQAPGFKRYLEKYSRLSTPIDRLEILRDKLGGVGLDKVTNASSQIGNDGATYTLSQAKMKGANQGIDAAMTKEGLQLAPRQSDILSRVQGDLDANALAASGGKPLKSDTYQNMAAANLMDAILGNTLASSGAGRVLRGPLNLVTKPIESRVSDAVMKAYFDPKEMERLLRMSKTTHVDPTLRGLLSDLQQYSSPRVTGGLLGALL